MKSFFFATAIASTAFFGAASAHTRVFSLWVDGQDQGEGAGKYIRQPPSNSPVKDLTSTDIRCNVGGTTAVSGKVEVAAGALVQPEWFHDNRGDDIIDGSHVGPIVAYLAPAESNGEGDVWVKISEEGFAGGEWAVDKLKKNGGKHDVTLPADLAAGEYIMRVEILALHESDTLFSENPARGIQLYPSCSQLSVTGSGSTSLPAGVSFPGAYTDADPGIHFNVYSDDASSYVIPGPAVWDGASSGGSPSQPSSSVAVPEPSSSVVPEEPASSSVPAPPVPTSAVPTTTAVPTTAAPPTTAVPTTSAPQPTGGAGTCTKDKYNCCMDAYNACADKANASSRGGNVDFSTCAAERDTCVSGSTRRHARDIFRL